VDPWAAILMGALSGSIPWYTMMVLHKRLPFFQNVDDTLGVFHTHAVAGILGGILSGVFAKPKLLRMLYGPKTSSGPGLFCSYFDDNISLGIRQILYQLLGAIFITIWNVVITSLICIILSYIVDLRMQEEDLEVGDDAAHGEEAYVLWGDGESMILPLRLHKSTPNNSFHFSPKTFNSYQ
jgi:Amt family ammonium transporter